MNLKNRLKKCVKYFREERLYFFVYRVINKYLLLFFIVYFKMILIIVGFKYFLKMLNKFYKYCGIERLFFLYFFLRDCCFFYINIS